MRGPGLLLVALALLGGCPNGDSDGIADQGVPGGPVDHVCPPGPVPKFANACDVTTPCIYGDRADGGASHATECDCNDQRWFCLASR